MNQVTIQSAPFDIDRIIAEMNTGYGGIGAIVHFIGRVRHGSDGESITAMTIEHYSGMTERAIDKIMNQATARWNIINIRVAHRIGTLYPTDPIVLVIVASAHRRDAFAACEFIMDYLKTKAPFWKKEQTANGSCWVQAKRSDTDAARRWGAVGRSEGHIEKPQRDGGLGEGT